MKHQQGGYRPPESRQARSKRGVVLICVIACLTIVTLMLGGMLKRTLLTKRQSRAERNLRQTQWLVQAGAERAAFRLRDDAQYEGERWSLPPEAIVGSHPGVVNITVDQQTDKRANVLVVAEYPAGSETSVRRTREFHVDLSQQ